MKTRIKIKRTLVLFLISFAVSEISVRIIFDTPSLSFLEKTNLSVYYGDNYQKLIRPNQYVYQAISDLEYDSDSIKYKINNLGYRGRDLEYNKKNGEIRIVIIGGSHVFDIFCSNQKGGSLFTSELEHGLRKSGLNVRVINAGIPGQDLKNIILRMRGDIQKLNPDYIVLNSTHNDIRWINYTDTCNMGKTIDDMRVMPREKLGINPFVDKYGWSDRAFGFSKLYLQLRRVYWNNKMTTFMEDYASLMKGRDYELGISKYDMLVKEFIQISEEMGAKPIICLEEHILSSNSEINENNEKFHMKHLDGERIEHSTILRTYKDCDSILIDRAIKHKVSLIDVVERFRDRKDLFDDLIHTSDKGSLLMSQLYTTRLFNIINGDGVANQ